MTPALAANLLACHLLLDDAARLDELHRRCDKVEKSDFWRHNLAVATGERSWNAPSMRGALHRMLLQPLADERPTTRPAGKRRQPAIAVSASADLTLDFGPTHLLVSIGRLPANDLPLDEPSVSRRHCALVREGGGVVLHDLGSTLGAYLGRPGDDSLRRVAHRAVLTAGTGAMQAGSVRFEVVIGERSLL